MPFTADLNKLENAKREALQQKEHWNRRWRMASGEVQTLTLRLSGMPTTNSQYRQLHAERADAIDRREKYARAEYNYGRAVHKIEDRIQEVLRQGKSAKADNDHYRQLRELQAELDQMMRTKKTLTAERNNNTNYRAELQTDIKKLTAQRIKIDRDIAAGAGNLDAKRADIIRKLSVQLRHLNAVESTIREDDSRIHEMDRRILKVRGDIQRLKGKRN